MLRTIRKGDKLPPLPPGAVVKVIDVIGKVVTLSIDLPDVRPCEAAKRLLSEPGD